MNDFEVEQMRRNLDEKLLLAGYSAPAEAQHSYGALYKSYDEKNSEVYVSKKSDDSYAIWKEEDNTTTPFGKTDIVLTKYPLLEEANSQYQVLSTVIDRLMNNDKYTSFKLEKGLFVEIWANDSVVCTFDMNNTAMLDIEIAKTINETMAKQPTATIVIKVYYNKDTLVLYNTIKAYVCSV